MTEDLRLPQQVVVTGGSGKLGRAVVADLLQYGWAVINVDQTPPPKDQGCPHVRVDLTDFGQAVEALTTIPADGVDAVVHLAAIPAPGITSNAATFANNAPSTYNLFAAARLAGIRNVVGHRVRPSSACRSTPRRRISRWTRTTRLGPRAPTRWSRRSRSSWQCSSAAGIRS